MTERSMAQIVMVDTFRAQTVWASWFFGFLILANIISVYFFNRSGEPIPGFLAFSQNSVSIFMLVVGIMAAYGFFAFFVGTGFTRKATFSGIAGGALLLAVLLTVLTVIVGFLEGLIIGSLDLSVAIEPPVIFGLEYSMMLQIFFNFLQTVLYFFVGWMIGTGYYRNGWVIGFLFVIVALFIFSLNDAFVNSSGIISNIPWMPDVSFEAGAVVSAMVTVTMIVLLAIWIRLMTKRISIKLQ